MNTTQARRLFTGNLSYAHIWLVCRMENIDGDYPNEQALVALCMAGSLDPEHQTALSDLVTFAIHKGILHSVGDEVVDGGGLIACAIEAK